MLMQGYVNWHFSYWPEQKSSLHPKIEQILHTAERNLEFVA